MNAALALAALGMGLAGGPHCAAMCGAACGGIVRAAPVPGAMWRFQLGRLLGYTAAGAAAGFAVQSFAWMADHAAALRPVWTLFHLGVLAWGLALLVLARQPAWVEQASRRVWMRIGPMARSRNGLVAAGALWTFMPCGLLWSALLIASLAGGWWQGGAAMALFALGSGAALGFAPSLLAWLTRVGNRVRGEAGTRACGLLLAGSAAWALWMDVAHRVAVWCGLA